MTPPCGVPCSVLRTVPSSLTPELRHLQTNFRSFLLPDTVLQASQHELGGHMRAERREASPAMLHRGTRLWY